MASASIRISVPYTQEQQIRIHKRKNEDEEIYQSIVVGSYSLHDFMLCIKADSTNREQTYSVSCTRMSQGTASEVAPRARNALKIF